MKEYKFKDLSEFFNGKVKIKDTEALAIIRIMSISVCSDFGLQTRQSITLDGIIERRDSCVYWDSRTLDELREVYYCIQAIINLGDYSKKLQTSYRLKHDVEKLTDTSDIGHKYISNGALIMALILTGKEIRLIDDDLNVKTNLKFKDIEFNRSCFKEEV